MSKRVAFSCDSTCDLSKSIINKYGIKVVPLYINKENESLRDGIDIVPEDIYKNFEQTGRVTKTSAATVQDYIDAFSHLTADGSAVIHINISSDMSTCFQNASIAAREFDNVYPIDSKNLSTGSGLLVMEGLRLAETGMEAAEIAHILQEDIVPKIEASFVIDTLAYLYKGGRCSALAALGANILKLKPCIEVKNGKMDTGKKYRGAIEKCITEYVKDRLSGRDDIDTRRIFITHTIFPADVVDKVRETIKLYADFDEIFETDTGCTISNHCGPKTLGILFIRK